MRLKHLLLMSLWGMLAFLGVSSRTGMTTTPSLNPHEAMLIPLFHDDPNIKGSSVFWSPDSRYVAVSNPLVSISEAVERGVRYGVFDITTGKLLFDIRTFIDWLPDSQHIVTRDGDTTDAQIRDVPTGKVTMILKGAQIGWKWNSDRTQAASESTDNNLHIYDLASGAILRTWRNILVKDALWSADDRLIAVFGVDTILRVYDVITGSLKGQLLGYQPLGWKSDNRQLIVTPQKRDFPDQLAMWTLESGATTIFDVLSMSYLWSPDGKELAIVATDQSVHILDANTGKLVQKIEGFESKISYFR